MKLEIVQHVNSDRPEHRFTVIVQRDSLNTEIECHSYLEACYHVCEQAAQEHKAELDHKRDSRHF